MRLDVDRDVKHQGRERPGRSVLRPILLEWASPSRLARVKKGTGQSVFGILDQSSICTRLGHDNKHWKITQSGISYFSAGALIIDVVPRRHNQPAPHDLSASYKYLYYPSVSNPFPPSYNNNPL